MLKQFGTFIAWFSGSVAGITAGLYALGFVATIGTDQVLGIGSALASRDPGFYVGRGGSLVMRTVLVAMWPVLGMVIAAAALRWLHARLSTAHRESLSAVRRIASTAAAPMTAAAMSAIALYGLLELGPALNTSGLLFAEEIPEEVCKEDQGLREAIFSQNRAELNSWFDSLVLGAGVLAGLGVIARQQLARAGQGLWLAIAGIAGFLTLVSVPFAYGIMVVQINPPEVQIDPPLGNQPGPTRLLSRSDGGLLVWLEKQRRVQWISAGRIDILTVGPGEPIATLRCPSGSGQPSDGG